MNYVLITGAAGLIGTGLREQFAGRYKLRLTDARTPPALGESAVCAIALTVPGSGPISAWGKTIPICMPLCVSIIGLFREHSLWCDSHRLHRPSIRSAAFSPIIIEGALMLPLVMLGMMEASATRRPSTPRTRVCGSTTDKSPSPILQLPHGW